MAKRPRRKFKTGFKKQLATQIDTGQIAAAEAARTHSISPTVHILLEKTIPNRRTL